MNLIKVEVDGLGEDYINNFLVPDEDGFYIFDDYLSNDSIKRIAIVLRSEQIIVHKTLEEGTKKTNIISSCPVDGTVSLDVELLHNVLCLYDNKNCVAHRKCLDAILGDNYYGSYIAYQSKGLWLLNAEFEIQMILGYKIALQFKGASRVVAKVGQDPPVTIELRYKEDTTFTEMANMVVSENNRIENEQFESYERLLSDYERWAERW